MNTINTLDKTIITLHKMSSSKVITLEDISTKSLIDKQKLSLALNYLCRRNFSENINGNYHITFEGEHFIETNKFVFKNRPFFIENIYKKFKIIALILNSLLILSIGVLNYMNNVSKVNNEKKHSKTTEKINEISIKIDSNKTKIDTIKPVK